MRIQAELSTHGLGRDAIAAAIESCERDWDASALDLAQRRFAGRNLGDPAQRRRAFDLLLRRGFSQRSAQAALRRVAGAFEAD
jgi:regulatory protein